MNILTSDFEVTTWNKGSPFDSRNFAVCLGYKDNNYPTNCSFDFSNFEGELGLHLFDLYVFFNAKFDLHWYRKLGVNISNWRIWCCQLAEFFLEGQKNPYPSLENTAVKYDLGHKIDVIKEQYWDKGINTNEIPRELLATYCKQDVELTYQIYLKQLEQFKQKPKLFQLFKIACQDLLVLEEMEYNGMMLDMQLCNKKATEIEEKINAILESLSSIYPDIPINFNSPQQISAFLYGGVIKETIKEQIGYFKTGSRTGEPKFKNVEIEHQLPRLVGPLPKSELANGSFATDEGTLRKLKGKQIKKYVEQLLELAKLDKLLNTYYNKLPELVHHMHWENSNSIGTIHGQFNQCVAVSGRLSSSKPNMQNFATECLDIFVSRYKE